MSRIMTTVITSFLFTGMGLAQASSSSDRETIRLLVQQVKELQEKVKALKAKQSDSEATPPQPTTFQRDVAEQAAEPNQSPIAPPALGPARAGVVNVWICAWFGRQFLYRRVRPFSYLQNQ